MRRNLACSREGTVDLMLVTPQLRTWGLEREMVTPRVANIAPLLSLRRHCRWFEGEANLFVPSQGDCCIPERWSVLFHPVRPVWGDCLNFRRGGGRVCVPHSSYPSGRDVRVRAVTVDRRNSKTFWAHGSRGCCGVGGGRGTVLQEFQLCRCPEQIKPISKTTHLV